ncbi:hypothetical protein NQ318_005215 [Aromia moschata]|uniref:Mos1 transposase HTH domain-containing protein n=1 Tax=Aromia moschata TaxID=1265417 RepID=A0AAV8XKD2_9CUCU|nr:hypothetical protein NQ318_005215 [Aromia moschata]
MQRSLEQRMAIKFCVNLEKTAAETIPMLKKAFGVDCLSDRQIFRWHKAFAEGREDVNDRNRAGRPSTSSSDDNVKRVRDLLNTDRRSSKCPFNFETLDITKTFVHEIVSESLGMRKGIDGENVSINHLIHCITAGASVQKIWVNKIISLQLAE